MRLSGRVGGLALAVLALAGVLAAGCSVESSFGEPTNPVSQIPWPDYELATYAMYDQTDAELGTLELEAQREGDRYRLRVLFDVTSTSTRDEALLWVDGETLSPIRYERNARSPDETVFVAGEYGVDGDGEAIVDVVVVDEEGERFEERLSIGEFAFDNETSAWLWRTLAFEQDLELTYRSVNLAQRRSQLVQLAVQGQDVLRGPDGEDVTVWQVAATPGVEVSRAWYEVEAPHRLIRWDQQPRRFVLREVVTEPR